MRLFTNGSPEMFSDSSNTYCVRNYVERIFTTLYHPQANGRFKLLNGSLAQLFFNMTQYGLKREWDQHLAAVLLALRTWINRGTGFSHITLALGEPAHLQEQPYGFFRREIPAKSP